MIIHWTQLSDHHFESTFNNVHLELREEPKGWRILANEMHVKGTFKTAAAAKRNTEEAAQRTVANLAKQNIHAVQYERSPVLTAA